MPPLAKPPGQRRRRNVDQAQWNKLPSEGRKGRAPKLPEREWLKSTVGWWQTIWSSPMATVWLDADVESLVRLAILKDEFMRGDMNSSSLPAMQQLEDRFGLSPKARRALQWEVQQSEHQAKVVQLKPVKLAP